VKLEELARDAVSDLLDASAVQAVGGYANLQRRRRRRVLIRGACAVTVLALVVCGLALADTSHGRQVRPAGPEPGITNGALLGFAVAQRSDVKVLTGALPVGSPLDRLLPTLRKVVDIEFSPDGTELSYYDPQSRRLITVDLHSGRRHTVWRCTDAAILCSGWAALSPDGHRVARLTGFGNPRLEVTDLSSGKLLVYRPLEWAGLPMWSPHGSSLAVVTFEGITIFEPNLTPRLLVPLDLHYQFVSLSWSPDGTRLAYVEPSPLGNASKWTSFRLVVADVATGSTRAIRDLGQCICNSLAPPQIAWSPDGQLIATTTISSRSLTQDGDVLVMRPDGSDVQPVGVNQNLAWLAWQPVPAEH
jgi:Tol biopolymer transport system component